MDDKSPSLRDRLRSWGWDYLLILAWLAVVFVIVGIPQLLGWIDLAGIWTDPFYADVAVTVLTVIPYLAYLVVTESGRWQATVGKQRAGLVVSTIAEEKPTTWQVLVRNVVKVLPWQLGHMGSMRLATMEQVTTTAVVLEMGSMVVLAGVVIPIFFGRRGVHDLAAGTRVQAA